MRLCLAFVVGLLMALQAHAAPLMLTADMQHESLAGRLEHFADASDTLSFDDARQRTFALLPGFKSQGYDAAAHWYRFALNRESGAPARWILAVGLPHLDEVDIWVEQPDGGFRQYAMGDHRPYDARPLRTRHFAVPIDVAATTTIYLRVHSTSTINVQAAIWQPEAFVADETRANLFYGLYFGLLAIIVVLFLMLGTWLRDVVLLAYGAYAGLSTLAYLASNGFVAVLLKPGVTWMNDLLLGAGLLGAIAALAFMWRRALELERHFPRIDRLYRLLSLTALILMPFVATPAYRLIAQFVVPSGMALALVTPVLLAILWWPKRPAELLVYFIAFLPTTVGGLSEGGVILGVLPKNFSPANLLQITSLVHVLVMSFGLSLRLRQIQRDKARAEQESAIAMQRADEERRFVAMLSHEFRNPLAVIDRSAQMIQIKAPELAEPETRRLEQIRTNTATLVGFVNNFLMTEALDHGAMALSRQHCALRPLLEDAVTMQGEGAAERVRLAVTPPDAAFDLDPTLIGVAVGNLLGNALRYSPPDSVVDLSAAVNRYGLCIRVVDRGPGLSDDELAKLGMPYYRATSSLGKKGSGLGYHFTRRIVEAHGGRLEARSVAGFGLEVELTLP